MFSKQGVRIFSGARDGSGDDAILGCQFATCDMRYLRISVAVRSERLVCKFTYILGKFRTFYVLAISQF